MLNHFRKLRGNLLDPGKLKKYSIYALGEIALVIIGILIALQINNWNEQRKSNKQINLLLYNLVEAINEDIFYLRQTAELHEFRSNSLLYLLKYSIHISEVSSTMPVISQLSENTMHWEGPYPDTLNMEFVRSAITWSGVNNEVVINKNALDELKNTGLFSAINDETLKKSMNVYYSYVNSHFLIEDWNQQLCNSWRQFLRDNYGVLTMEMQFKEDPLDFIRKNEPVQLRIHEMIGPARFRSRNGTQAIELAEGVIKEIEKYLNH